MRIIKKIAKSKSLNTVLILSLAMSTCYTQAFWPTQLIKKGFLAVKSKWLGASTKKTGTGINRKKLILGISVAAATLVAAAVYEIFKTSDSTDQTGANKEALEACARGDLEKLKELANKGVNLDPCEPEKDLWYCFLMDNFSLIPKKWESPMYKAVINGHVEIIKFLLDQGVDIEAIVYKKNMYRETALTTAINTGNFDSVKCLVENGAKINGVDTTYLLEKLFRKQIKNRETIVEYLVNNGLCLIHQRQPEKILKNWAEKYRTKYLNSFGLRERLFNKRKELEFSGNFRTPPAGSSYGQIAKFVPATDNELEEMLNDREICPCYIRQRALIALLARYKQRGPSLSSKKHNLEKWFKTVPFNLELLREINNIKCIKFIVQNNITDKFGRDIITACTQCCRDEHRERGFNDIPDIITIKCDDIIDAVISSYFEISGTIEGRKPENVLIDLHNFLGIKERKGKKKGKVEEILLYAKKRNEKLYKHFFNKSYVYAQLGIIKELPDELSSYIASF